MARNEVFIGAAPERVYEVLSAPASYSEWVVGTQKIRAADPDWPQPGSEFAHSVGTGPLRINDRTRVVDAEPPVMLKLRACARPLPSADVTLLLQPEGDGTRLTMLEAPSRALLSALAGPLGHWVLALRNGESLRRLKELVEDGRTPARRPASRVS